MKYEDASTISVRPTATVTGGIAPFGCGARFGTVTEKSCLPSKPPGSEALTVTVAIPGATALTVTVVSDKEAVATPGSDDVTE